MTSLQLCGVVAERVALGGGLREGPEPAHISALWERRCWVGKAVPVFFVCWWILTEEQCGMRYC